jgi:hypothetical protein
MASAVWLLCCSSIDGLREQCKELCSLCFLRESILGQALPHDRRKQLARRSLAAGRIPHRYMGRTDLSAEIHENIPDANCAFPPGKDMG